MTYITSEELEPRTADIECALKNLDAAHVHLKNAYAAFTRAALATPYPTVKQSIDAVAEKTRQAANLVNDI